MTQRQRHIGSCTVVSPMQGTYRIRVAGPGEIWSKSASFAGANLMTSTLKLSLARICGVQLCQNLNCFKRVM